MTDSVVQFDGKEFALGTLRRAKELLTRDKYLAPVAFVLTANKEILACGLNFSNEEEKVNSYRNLAELARANGALAVVTINDARVRRVESDSGLEGYYWGQLRDEGAAECIFMAVKTSKMKAWGVSVEYTRKAVKGGEEIVFGRERVFDELDVQMIPDW